MLTDEISYLDHIVAREITNGMWFLASVFLLASMLKFVTPRLIRNPRVWQYDVDVRLAWGILLIAAGTALRAGWIWALLIASSLNARGAVRFIEAAFGRICTIPKEHWKGGGFGVGSDITGLPKPRDVPVSYLRVGIPARGHNKKSMRFRHRTNAINAVKRSLTTH